MENLYVDFLFEFPILSTIKDGDFEQKNNIKVRWFATDLLISQQIFIKVNKVNMWAFKNNNPVEMSQVWPNLSL
jgi:hypothetical protein